MDENICPSWSQLTTWEFDCDIPDNALPKEGVLKISNPIMGRAIEGELFRPLSGRFGVAEVVASGIVPGQGTINLIANAKFLPTFYEADKAPKLQPRAYPRVSYRVLMGSVGEPLAEIWKETPRIPTPYELLRMILHGIIGAHHVSCIVIPGLH